MKWRPLVIWAATLLGGLAARIEATEGLPSLATVREVRELSREVAEGGRPVLLRGVLTFHEPAWFLSFVQDATGGIYVKNFNPALRAGMEVEVEGVSAAGRTLPIVAGRDAGEAQVRVLGSAPWPEPIEAVANELSGDVYDAQWMNVCGRVTAVTRAHDGVRLDLVTGGVAVRAAIPRWPQSWSLPGYLRGQDVSVRGVLGRPIPQPADSDVQAVLYVPSLEAVEVAPEALTGLFDRPLETFNRLFEFEITRDPPRVRIRGQTQFARSGLGFFLTMEGGGNVWVQTSAPGRLASGDWVEAVGWLEMFDGRPLLTDAFFRVEKPGRLPSRWQRTASEVKAGANSAHGAMIAVEGRLVEQQRSVGEDSLVLEDQGVMFLARLLHTGGDRLPTLERGMRLRSGGLCLAKQMPLLENLPSTFAFQLWLTSPADAEILERPPWWTVRRVFWLCGLTVVLGLLAAGWVVLLRRQVTRQTSLIGRQLEREAVARERARIARELHDSLGQELVGIALQLDSAAARLGDSPEQAERALNLARRMIRHTQAEAKRSVADLRAEELNRGSLSVALEELIQPLVATTPSTRLGIEVRGEPRRLEGIVEHHLLRLGQEAVANAVRHASAGEIQVRIEYREQAVLLEVQDDGRGFDANEALATAAGHFGLLGLRERANKLQGRLRIDSQPGKGTTVSVTVPLHEHQTI